MTPAEKIDWLFRIGLPAFFILAGAGLWFAYKHRNDQ